VRDVARFGRLQAERLVGPTLPGVSFTPEELAAAIHVPADKLGETLDNIDELRLRLTSARIRRRKAMTKAGHGRRSSSEPDSPLTQLEEVETTLGDHLVHAASQWARES
jgi:hypothetical protein